MKDKKKDKKPEKKMKYEQPELIPLDKEQSAEGGFVSCADGSGALGGCNPGATPGPV
jgi:hypothetical protein